MSLFGTSQSQKELTYKQIHFIIIKKVEMPLENILFNFNMFRLQFKYY